VNYFKQFKVTDSFWRICGYSAILFLCLLAFIQTSIIPKELILTQNNEILDSSKQIYFANYQQGEVIFSTKIEKKPFQQTNITIQVDDCLDKLEINGQEVNLSKYSKDRFCSWDRGIEVDFGNYLKTGQNDVKFSVSNYGGEAGLKINPSVGDLTFLFTYIVALIFIILLLYEILRVIKLDNLSIFLIILATLIRLIYLSYTGFNTRQHDSLGDTGHLGFINYFATNLRLPDPATGFEYHQAPLYYIISGAVVAGLKWLGLYNVFDILQLFSVAYFIAFLTFGVKLLTKLVTKNWLYYLTISLLLFWPSGVIHSVRITNDSLFWMFFAGFIYYVFQWLENINPKNFFLICVFFSLGMITKTSMVLALPMFFAAVGLHFIYKIDWKKFNLEFIKIQFSQIRNLHLLSKLKSSKATRLFSKLKQFYLAILGLIMVGISFIINPDFVAVLTGKSLNQVIGSTQLNSVLKVGEGLQHYLFFDVKSFLTSPFLSSWSDESGRQWFWNFFLKSSLFGEFSFGKELSQNLAIAISFAFFALIIALIYYFFSVKNFTKQNWLMLAILISFVLGNMLHRKENPYAPNSDFRFVFPVLIPIVYFINQMLELLHTKKQYLALFISLFASLTIIFGSVIFFINLLLNLNN